MKDSLLKIEDEHDKNTKVEVLDEWKNETHPDKNGKTEGIRTTKNSEPYADVTGSNKPEGRDEQAEALKEEREKEDELENNRGEPQENGATYHGTNKTRKHTCDAHWAEQKHIHTDSPNTIETCVHVDNAEGMGGKVKSEGGAVSTGTEGANNPVNSGKPDKKTIPRIIREFEDEGHGDPFDDKAMDKDDKEMLERADLEEEKKLEHAHDEPDGPERTKADPPEKQSFEGKNQINAGEKHSQEGKNYDREINPGMPGNSPEKVDKIAPLIAAAGGALARGAAGAGRVIGRGAKQVGQEVGADLGIDDDESQLQKATLDILRLTWETKTQKKTTSLVKGDPSSFGDDDYTPYEGKGPGDKKFVRPEKEDEKTPKKEQMPRWMRRQRKAPEVIENKRSRFHSNTNVSHGDLPRPQRDPPPVNQSGKTSKETQDKKIQSISNKITSKILNGGKLLFCGNGGSAADSQHLAAELIGRFKKNRKPISSIALTTDTSIITSTANDFSYEDIFSEDLHEDWKPVKHAVENWPPDVIGFGLHVRFFLLSTSFAIFGNYRVIPFLASVALIITTYLFTNKITNNRLAGIIATVIILQSNLFLSFSSTPSYTVFWVMFYLASLYLTIHKTWFLSPFAFILSVFSKPLSATFFPISLFFILALRLSLLDLYFLINFCLKRFF